MDWVAFGAISNTILVAALVGITIYYAMQTKNQANSMQKQMAWERTFRPRLDSYTRFIEVMSKRLMDTTYLRYAVVPQLQLVQPYSSYEVKTKARELYDYAENHRCNNEGRDPHDINNRIRIELRPMIIKEIEDMTNEMPFP